MYVLLSCKVFLRVLEITKAGLACLSLIITHSLAAGTATFLMCIDPRIWLCLYVWIFVRHENGRHTIQATLTCFTG